MRELERVAQQLVSRTLLDPTPLRELERRAYARWRHRRERNATLLGASVVLAAAVVGVSRRAETRRSHVSTVTMPERHPTVKILVDTTLTCSPTVPDPCVPDPDGVSALELQMAGISRGFIVPTQTTTNEESEVGRERPIDSRCPARCFVEQGADTGQKVAPREIARRIEALRSGASERSKPDQRIPSPCLEENTERDLGAFLGLAPGFAVRLAAENNLELRTIGTNGRCHSTTGRHHDDRVNIDVVNGIVVGARWG